MKNIPKILNILGLAVAIAAFLIVAMVRYYDLRYDKSYPGADRISIMGPISHRPGALYSLLARFAVLGVNLTKIESRPKRGEDFEYTFYLDFEASMADPEVRALLCELVAGDGKFTFLGNYSEK